MSDDRGSDSVVVLFKGGRLPAWHDLSPETRDAYEQEHIDLMLSVAREHGLRRIEGFRLITAQGPWVRYWVIEFPTMAGAEAWIEAEIRPPYGPSATTSTSSPGRTRSSCSGPGSAGSVR